MRDVKALLVLLSVVLAWLGLQAPARAALIEPDLRLPGAEARLGLGGGWWPGAWVELRLEASGPGRYVLRLEAEEGGLRTGLVPVSARLEVRDEPGVRVARLRVPLWSRRPARLTLEGPTGQRSARLEPYPFEPAVALAGGDGATGPAVGALGLQPSEVVPDPALWLARPSLTVSEPGLTPAPGGVLAWLAAGGTVLAPAGLAGLGALPVGVRVGLGRVEAGSAGSRAPGTPVLAAGLEAVVAAAASPVGPPERRSPALALWAGGVFLASLAVYSARRDDPRAAAWGGVAAAAGLAGLFALAPRDGTQTATSRLVLGASGWGLHTEIVSRRVLTAGTVLLPPEVRPLGPRARLFTVRGTEMAQPAWSSVTYWTPPTAGTLPLTARNGQIINTGRRVLDPVYVVGGGQQEPLGPGATRLVANGRADEAPPGLERLAALLPEGSAVARLRDEPGSVLVALPVGALPVGTR